LFVLTLVPSTTLFRSIQVRVQGQYHAVGRFFDDVAHLERVISVDGVQIEAASQDTQCLATTFRFLDEAEAHEAAAAAKKAEKKRSEEHTSELQSPDHL